MKTRSGLRKKKGQSTVRPRTKVSTRNSPDPNELLPTGFSGKANNYILSSGDETPMLNLEKLNSKFAKSGKQKKGALESIKRADLSPT